MQPLEPFRDQLVTISKMRAPWGESIHVGASSAFLNGVGPVGRAEPATRSARSSRRRPSTSTSPTRSRRHAAALDRGRHRGHGHRRGRVRRLPCTFFNALSWRDDDEPAAGRDQSARHLRADVRRDRLDRAARARLKEKQSLLDSVTHETSKLRARSARRTARSSTSI
jgi:hypothetical protein